jgi:hypothetical protein
MSVALGREQTSTTLKERVDRLIEFIRSWWSTCRI